MYSKSLFHHQEHRLWPTRKATCFVLKVKEVIFLRDWANKIIEARHFDVVSDSPIARLPVGAISDELVNCT